jgi:hypothetical protein
VVAYAAVQDAVVTKYDSPPCGEDRILHEINATGGDVRRNATPSVSASKGATTTT